MEQEQLRGGAEIRPAEYQLGAQQAPQGSEDNGGAEADEVEELEIPLEGQVINETAIRVSKETQSNKTKLQSAVNKARLHQSAQV